MIVAPRRGSRAAALLRRLHAASGRILHPLRRRRALEGLRRRPPPARLLVLCDGNICRSPFAAAVLTRDLATAGVRVESAGFFGPGRPCPAEAVTAAAQRGVDLSAHRSTLLTAERLRYADLVVVMDPTQGRAVYDRFGRRRNDILVLGDLDPEPVATRTVRDPVEKPLEVFVETYARIDRCAAALVRVLASGPA